MVTSVTTPPTAHPVPGAHEVMVCILVDVIVSVTVEAPEVTDGLPACVLVDPDGSSVVELSEVLETEGVTMGYGAVMLALCPTDEFPETIG